jgi:uncharacterized protein involved in exopolysaccharide biosynthesis
MWLLTQRRSITGLRTGLREHGGVANSDLQNNIATALKLRHEVKRAREELHQKMAALREEMAAIRAKRRRIF